MIWVVYWFIVFLIEVGIWSYVIYLHFTIKELERPKVKFPKEHKVVVRTKRDIVRG